MSRPAHLGGLALVLCLLTACASGRAVPRPFPGAAVPPVPAEPVPAEPPAGAPGNAAGSESLPPGVPPPVVSTALTFTGTPYRNGGSDPAGFDCSGFVQYVFAQYGWRLPRSVEEQFKIGEEIDLEDVRPGDLVFFETVSRGASHVGIALGGDQFVHAPSSRGVVRVERYTIEYWRRRYIGARRIQ